MSNSLWPHGLQHTRFLCPSLFPRVCSDSCPLSQRGHPTISSSVKPFSFCPRSFPASVSFPMSQLFESGSQSTGASAPVLLMNIQGWFPLGLTGLISLQSKGFSRVFSTVLSHQFFSTQPSLLSSSHIHTCIVTRYSRRDNYICLDLFLKFFGTCASTLVTFLHRPPMRKGIPLLDETLFISSM